MSQFFGVLHHEFNMSLRRPGMWIAYFALFIFNGFMFFTPDSSLEGVPFPVDEPWQVAGDILFYSNMFMVILGGILSADRMQRDFRLGVRELQRSTPLRLPVYILAKYLGAVAGVITPMLVWVLLCAIFFITQGAPLYFIGVMFTAFLAMCVPAYAFVVAFSLLCPLFMPVRVYQILFVGYWFWGNYMNSGFFPTISNTLLVPSGKYVLYGFFGGFPSSNTMVPSRTITSIDAVLNLCVLFLCVVAVLFTLNIYLRWHERHA